jgi:hypothetical protein
VAVGQVSLPVLLFSLSVTFLQCSIHISIYMLPAAEEDETCIRSKSSVLSAVEDCEIESCFYLVLRSSPEFLNHRAAARYGALASIIPGRENLSF